VSEHTTGRALVSRYTAVAPLAATALLVVHALAVRPPDPFASPVWDTWLLTVVSYPLVVATELGYLWFKRRREAGRE
jgi:hypothetical protein